MVKVEVERVTRGQSQSIPQTELVVGLTGLVDAGQVRAVAAQWDGAGAVSLSFTLAFPE